MKVAPIIELGNKIGIEELDCAKWIGMIGSIMNNHDEQDYNQ